MSPSDKLQTSKSFAPIRFYRRANHNRCTVLFCFLLGWLLVLPFVYHILLARVALYILYVALMVAVVRSIRSPGWVLNTNVGLGLLYLVLIGAAIFTNISWLQIAGLTVSILFIVGVVMALLRHVMDFSRVTSDKLFGAVTIYILVAFLFADIYHVLYDFNPRHFRFGQEQIASAVDWSDFLYFSFTVLTTTGFGEITAASRVSRNIVIIEQMTGVMYVAFLIARLTELYPSRKRPQG